MKHQIIEFQLGPGKLVILDDEAYEDFLRRHSQKRSDESQCGAWAKPARDQEEIDQRVQEAARARWR